MADTEEEGPFPWMTPQANKDAQDLLAARKQNVSLAINLGPGPIMSLTSLKNL